MEGNLAILEGNFDWVSGKKGIFSSRGHESEDINRKKAYFQNFSWFQFYVSKLWMVISVSLLP